MGRSSRLGPSHRHLAWRPQGHSSTRSETACSVSNRSHELIDVLVQPRLGTNLLRAVRASPGQRQPPVISSRVSAPNEIAGRGDSTVRRRSLQQKNAQNLGRTDHHPGRRVVTWYPHAGWSCVVARPERGQGRTGRAVRPGRPVRWWRQTPNRRLPDDALSRGAGSWRLGAPDGGRPGLGCAAPDWAAAIVRPRSPGSARTWSPARTRARLSGAGSTLPVRSRGAHGRVTVCPPPQVPAKPP